jgi:integrase
MNVENLRNNYLKLLSRMEDAGYSKNYIYTFRTEIQWIISEAGLRDWDCYGDVYRDYQANLLPPNKLKTKHAIIGAIEQFDLHDRYPDSKWHSFKVRGSYPKLVPEFKSLIDYYCKVARERGKKESTIYMESHNASSFLSSLQEAGVNHLDDVTEKAVVSLFVSPDGRRLKCHNYRKCVSALLKACIPLNPDACRKVLSLLPETRYTRKNIQYLTPEEVQRVRNALDDMSNTLTLCDRAIGKLTLYTGLRGCDIATMKLTSIDWDCDIIRIEQQKTGNPLELPLAATVGNAIYDYLTNERPSVENPSLFLSLIGPYRGMEPDNMWNVSARIMKAAGIRQSKGERKGLHIFRHHLATTLLGNGVTQALISCVLGHSSPASTETYLSADFVHLKACALDISRFPVREGVFDVE